jgi:hypothetical protein
MHVDSRSCGDRSNTDNEVSKTLLGLTIAQEEPESEERYRIIGYPEKIYSHFQHQQSTSTYLQSLPNPVLHTSHHGYESF